MTHIAKASSLEKAHSVLAALCSPYPPDTAQTMEIRALRPKALKDSAEGSKNPVRFRKYYSMTPLDIRRAVRDGLSLSSTLDVYFSLLPRLRGQGGTEATTQAAWLFCGVDGEQEGEAGAIQLLQPPLRWKQLPRPQIVVASGHGLHVFWQLPAILPLTTERERETYQNLLTRIGLAIGGDTAGLKAAHADSAKISQNPRLPGSLNHKTLSRPLPVRLLRFVPCLDPAQRVQLWTPEMWAYKLPPLPTPRYPVRPLDYGPSRHQSLPPRLLQRAVTPAMNGTRHATLTSILTATRKGGYERDSLEIVGDSFLSANPGFPAAEVKSTIGWVMRNVQPAAQPRAAGEGASV